MHCAVSVNSQKLLSSTQGYQTTDKRVFESMKQALEDFVNGRRWTTLELQEGERLECSLSLILSERSTLTDFKGQLSLQLRRPVYGSTYTTGLFNYVESADFLFTYNENQPLDFDPNTFYGNLSSVTVSAGQHVSINQTLGSVGTGNILIFRLQNWDQPLNPKKWLSRL
jgi:hypothetical protein